MKTFIFLLVVPLLSSCATISRNHHNENSHTVPKTVANFFVQNYGELAIEKSSLPNEVYSYRVININDPAFHVTEEEIEKCYRKKSWIPKTGSISQVTWQLARQRDGKVIDWCANKFDDLRQKMLEMVITVRGQ